MSPTALRFGGGLNALLHGSGGTLTPVVALHDLGGTARRWDAAAEVLAARGHPVAAVDLRAHGGSAALAASDLGALAADVADLVSHLGWSPVVAGHGFGAAVGLRLAADRPGVARAHVWIAGGITDLPCRYADWPTASAAETPPYRVGDDAARRERMLRAQHPDWSEVAVEGVLADAERLADGTLRPWLSPADHRTYLRHLWEQRPAALYPRVGDPVVVVVAEEVEASTTRWALAEDTEVAAASSGLLRVRVARLEGDRDLLADRPDSVAALIAGA